MTPEQIARLDEKLQRITKYQREQLETLKRIATAVEAIEERTPAFTFEG